MNKITACMIIKNEDDKIYDTLVSISKVFDEIVIIDTGSTDNTISEVNRAIQHVLTLKERVVKNFICDYFDWVDDFSAARNFSFSKATQDFVTWWDADDKMTEKLAEFIERFRILDSFSNADIVHIPTVIKYVDNKPIQFIDNARIVRRSLNPHWIYPIHEQLLFDKIKGDIIHSNIEKGEVVDAVKDYSNKHHLNFYKNLVEKRGYKFTMHDLYFFLNEMLITNDLSWWDWYKEVLRKTVKEHTDYPGYLGMIFKRIKYNFQEFFDNQFNEIKEVIFEHQLRHYGAESRLCIWIGEYYEKVKGSYGFALEWYRIGMNSNLLPDYEKYDIELAQQQAHTHYQKLLKDIVK